MEQDNDGLAGADVMKLAAFVAMNTSPETLSRFDDGYVSFILLTVSNSEPRGALVYETVPITIYSQVIHEQHIMNILNHIKDNNGMKENAYLARSIKYFTVTKPKTAHDVRKIINEISESDSGNIVSHPQCNWNWVSRI